MFKRTVMFAVGGIFYIMIEMLWRGYSHWSMFILGGVCFTAAGVIGRRNNIPILLRAALCAAVITALEFLTGYILNIMLGLGVWSYKEAPMNIMGQICLPYTALWFVLSLAGIAVYNELEKRLFIS